jgi:hypothetical protein
MLNPALDVSCLAEVADLDGFIGNDGHRAEEVLDGFLGGERKRDAADAESGNDGRDLDAQAFQDQEQTGSEPDTDQQPVAELDGGDFARLPNLPQLLGLQSSDQPRQPDEQPAGRMMMNRLAAWVTKIRPSAVAACVATTRASRDRMRRNSSP